jgi:GT2 family glycosyltransferase
MSGDRPSVAITVVSSNEKLLVPCLETLFQNMPQNCDVKVYATWNGPGRGLARMSDSLPQRFPQVQFTESFTGGFPFNQNRMLERIEADYYLVANDDLLFLPGSVEKAVAFMEQPENTRIGNLGIKFLNADHTLQPSTYSFTGLPRAILAVSGLRGLIPLDAGLFGLAKVMGIGNGKSRYWAHDRTIDVDTYRGSYMLVRGAALKEVGVMDDVGGEETEWHMRFHKLGWRVTFYPGAEVVHLGSMTTKTYAAAELISVSTQLSCYYKHRSRWRYNTLRLGFITVYLIKYLGGWLRGSAVKRNISRRGLSLIVNWPASLT